MKMMAIIAGTLLIFNGVASAAPTGTVYRVVQIDSEGHLIGGSTNLITANGIATTAQASGFLKLDTLISVTNNFAVTTNLSYVIVTANSPWTSPDGQWFLTPEGTFAKDGWYLTNDVDTGMGFYMVGGQGGPITCGGSLEGDYGYPEVKSVVSDYHPTTYTTNADYVTLSVQEAFNRAVRTTWHTNTISGTTIIYLGVP
jgi:hypothetical protein